MARATIEFMNARREAKPASGGRIYLNTRNPVDDAAQYAELDYVAQFEARHDLIQSEFRSVMRNMVLPTAESIMAGERLEDLEF